MNKRPLSINDCKNNFKDVHNNNKVVSIDKIQNVTSNFFSINLQEMLAEKI